MGRTVLGAVISLAAAFAACVGADPQTTDNPTADGGEDGGGGDGSGGTDGAVSGCASCEGDLLRICNQNAPGTTDTTCALGCASEPTPHCRRPVPSENGVAPSDLDGTGLGAVSLVGNTTIDSDTGMISGIRAANADANVREVVGGVAFRRVDIPNGNGAKIGVFAFDSFTVGDARQVVVSGVAAVAFVAAKDITVLGTLDLRGTCTTAAGGPGGGAGGSLAGLAVGAGRGNVGKSNQSFSISGGAGGGFGDDGGDTFETGVGGTTQGGLPYGTATLVPLLGGSGGGRGGDANSGAASTGGRGGGGGGAVHLVAGGTITVGGGSAIGGINAGGCGGAGAAIPNMNLSGGGGGGGSGGAILLEAPTVKLDILGVLAVNGGAGGGGAIGNNTTAAAGDPGRLSYYQAANFGGAPAGSAGSCGNGGFGGASAEVPQTVKGQNGPVGGTGNCTGGGGGGAGRIRVNTSSGDLIVVNGTAYASPRFTDPSSHTTPVSTKGTLRVE